MPNRNNFRNNRMRGGSPNSSLVAYAHRVMRQVKNAGYSPYDIHDCVSCGQITSGGSGTVVDCNNCVSSLL